MKKVFLGLVLGLIICMSCILISLYNHSYIPTFSDSENEIICIQEEI